MNNRAKNNLKPQTLTHLKDYIKDDWVLSRKSIHAGGLIIEHHIQPPNLIEVDFVNHHFLGYLLGGFSSRQIMSMDDKVDNSINTRGDFWLKPSHISGFWNYKSTNECLIFAIKPAFLQKVALENNYFNPDRIEILPVIKSRDSQLDILAMQFKQEIDNTEFGNRMYIESLANIFAIHLLRNYCAFPAKLKQQQRGLPTYKLKLAINYINDNLDHPIKLNDIAQLLDISQYYFCHLFKESTGVAPYKYIIEQRVQKAKSLLKNSNLHLVDIAYECGFSSQSQMTQHFRKWVGVTPKVYRVNSR
ncbi:MAG: AraC family transcriptional regulator [Pleurocapsa sp. MO_226.B13]|nr:AraC family transcriptional regulator [Pleurocapsa sp. MO_226.B13]